MTERECRWADLFRRANRGDGVAYAVFLRETALVVRKIVAARSGGQPEEVEDTVQEVLTAIHTKRHTWRETDPVSPWLYAIARYKTADAWRRRGRPTLDIDDLTDVLPDEGAGDALAARDLDVLLKGIDVRSAQIVRAVGLEGRSAAEVGATLGMNEGAVRVAYHRAMTRLRADAQARREDAK
jgi:RNA polymerase sigma-70 factor (ECF subfamily)